MKLTALTTIICMFSVVIPIQSGGIIYDYDYDNFGKFFPQGDGFGDFHLYKYANIDDIFDENYEGTNVGGAFLVKGNSSQTTDVFDGYLDDITATYYCGSTHAEEGWNSLWMRVQYVNGSYDYTFLCQEKGWHYNQTWIPKTFSGNQVSIHSMPSDVSI